MDIRYLRVFYSSKKGKSVATQIRNAISYYQHDTNGINIGLGYTIPYITPPYVSLMPAFMGAVSWPNSDLCASALVNECNLPFADNSVDKALVIHCLEYSHSPHLVIQELWRILRGNGTLLLIVPYKYGPWAYLGEQPWSAGNAFSNNKDLLQKFTLHHSTKILYEMPWQKDSFFKRIGDSTLGKLGGLLFIKASKQIYCFRKSNYAWLHIPRLVLKSL